MSSYTFNGQPVGWYKEVLEANAERVRSLLASATPAEAELIRAALSDDQLRALQAEKQGTP